MLKHPNILDLPVGSLAWEGFEGLKEGKGKAVICGMDRME